MFGPLATIGLLQALTMAAMVLRTKILALLLGPEWLGVLGVIDRLLAVLTQAAALSLPFAALRFLPEAWGRGPQAYLELARRMRNLLALSALAVTVIGLLITYHGPQIWGDALAGYRSIVLAGMLCLPVLIFVPFVQNAIAGALRHNAAMLFGLAHALTLLAAGSLGAYWGGLQGLYLATAGCGLLLVCSWVGLCGQRLIRAAGAAGPSRGFPLALPRPIVRFGLAMLALAVLAPFAAFYVHYLVLDRFGTTTTGWLTAAVGVSFFLRALLGQAHAVFMTPQINRGGEPAERMAWLDDYQRMFTALCVVAVLPVLLFPHPVVSLVFSSEFGAAADFVAPFVIAEVMVLTAGPWQGLIVALEHLRFHVAQNLLAQGALVVVATLLVQSHGLAGAALAALSAPFVLCTSSIAFIRWRYGLSLSQRSWLMIAFLGAAAVLAGYIGVHYEAMTLAIILAKALVGLLLAGLVLVLLGPGDRATILAAVGTALAVRDMSGRHRS